MHMYLTDQVCLMKGKGLGGHDKESIILFCNLIIQSNWPYESIYIDVIFVFSAVPFSAFPC